MAPATREAFLVVLGLVLVAAQDTSWMLTTDSCGGFRQSGYDREYRYAVSSSTTWNTGASYDCPAGYVRATSSNAQYAFHPTTGKEHSEGTGLTYSGQCGWSGQVFAGQTRTYFRFSGGNYYKHSAGFDFGSATTSSTTSEFAGVVCHRDPANYPSWMKTTDSCYGFRQSLVAEGVHYAVSESSTWNKGSVYECPAGYRWISSVEMATLISGNQDPSGYHVYHSRCGWNGYDSPGDSTDRYYFRFNDSHINNAYKHTGNFENYQIQYTSSTNYFAGIVCRYDETLADDYCPNSTPETVLPDPVLQSVAIASNDMQVKWTVSKRFNEINVKFHDVNTTCNYNSVSNTNMAYWAHPTGLVDPCLADLTFTRNAQDMIASCGFQRNDVTSDRVVYNAIVAITTTQTRYLGYVQGHRNQTYTQIKTNHFEIEINVPFNISASVSSTNVTGNVTVLSAVSALAIDVSASPFKVSFSVITSSQDPYQLTYSADSFTSGNDLGNTATIAQNTPSCSAGPENSCTQQFDVSAIDITTDCEAGKETLSGDVVTLTFDVGCKAEFAGNCITPQPAQITATLQLSSSPYCPQVDNITLSGVLETYGDVDLTSTTAWATTDRTSQFVLGATLYAQIEVSVSQDAATAETTTVESVRTIGHQGATILVYDRNGGSPQAVGGTQVHETGFGGNDHKSQARMAVPLTAGVTVALDPVADAAQTVALQVVVSLTYTASSLPTGSNPVLQELHKSRTGRSRGVKVLETKSRSVGSTAVVSVGGTTTTASPASGPSSSSSIAGMSVMSVGVVAGGVAALVLATAYFSGRRSAQLAGDEHSEDKLQEHAQLTKSSSQVGIDVEVTASTSEEEEQSHDQQSTTA